MKYWIAVVTTVAVLAAASAHAAEHKHGGHAEGLLPPKVLDELALTADQKAKYDELVGQYQKEAGAWKDAHKADLDAAKQQMDAAKTANDEAKMKDAKKQMGELLKPLHQLHHQYVEKVKALLTDDQKTKLDAEMPHHGGKNK